MGRDDLLKRLHNQLQSNERIGITGVRGMGGIGKTELALQYAIASYNQQTYPGGVCWLQARDQEIATQIVSFAKENLGIKPPDELEADGQVRFTWQRWPEGDSLIILDDVTDYDAIAPYLPPPSEKFKILITTRVNLGSTVTQIEIEELTDEAAIALLKSIAGDQRIESQRSDAAALCKWVGNLPLGLELLGRFLVRKPDWAIAKLLKQLESKRLDARALVEGESGMTASLGVAAALELSWTELDEKKQELACLLGMFAVAPIPWNLVEQCFEDVDPDKLEEWRDDGLRDRSLIKRVGEGTYQLHQIVQEFFREKLRQKGDEAIALKKVFGRVMVAQAQILDDTLTLEQTEQVRKVIPHFEESAKLWTSCLSDEEFILPFLGIIFFYNSQFNYRESLLWANKCCELCKQKFGDIHPELAYSFGYLGDVYRLQRNSTQALDAYQQSLKIQQVTFGSKHIDIANTLGKIAALYKDQAEYGKSEKYYKDALNIFENLLPGNSPEVLTVYSNLAVLYSEKGLYVEAKNILEKNLKVLKDIYGEQHPEVVTTISNLAATYRSLGEYEQAEKCHQLVIVLKKKIYGDQHPKVAASLNNLGILYIDQNRSSDAQPLFEESLAIGINTYGEEHREVATTMNNLGMCYSAQSQYCESNKVFEKALKIKKQELGDDHPDIAFILNNIATNLLEQENFSDAEQLFREAALIRKNKLGKQHPDFAKSLWYLGFSYYKQQNFSAAKFCLETAFDIFEQKLDSTHPSTQNVRSLIEKLPSNIDAILPEELGL